MIEQILELRPIHIAESFTWMPDNSRFKELAGRTRGKFYKVTAMHPIVTDRTNEGHGPRRWTDAEVKASIRTLATKPLNLNHQIPITYGENLVLDAEWEDGRGEALIYIEDTEIQEAIRKGYIDKVSVQGKSRKSPEVCKDSICAETPEGTIFNALALIATKSFEYRGVMVQGEPPGDIRTKIEIIESLKSKPTKLIYSHKQKTQLTRSSMPGNITENLEGIITAIEGMPDIPPEIKTQLIDAAKQIYANAGGATDADAAAAAAAAAAGTPAAEGEHGQEDEVVVAADAAAKSAEDAAALAQTAADAATGDAKVAADKAVDNAEKTVDAAKDAVVKAKETMELRKKSNESNKSLKELLEKLTTKPAPGTQGPSKEELETLFNKVVDGKVAGLKEQIKKETKAAETKKPEKTAAQQLEGLNREDITKVLQEKLKDTELPELVEMLQKVNT